jgi:hypothetical protein
VTKPVAITTGTHRIEPRSLPSSARLETWIERTWTDGLQVDGQRDLDTVVVRTLNTVYEITIVTAQTGEAIVRGGRFFPEPTRAVILGSSLGGAFLKLRGIYCGFSLEIYATGTRIITSPVQSVAFVEDRHTRSVQ